jgi:hypothetical protein
VSLCTNSSTGLHCGCPRHVCHAVAYAAQSSASLLQVGGGEHVALLHCGEDGFPDDVIGQLTQSISKAIQNTQHEDYIRPNVLIPKAALGSIELSFRSNGSL